MLNLSLMVKTVLLHAKQAQRADGGTALTILHPGTRGGWSLPHSDCFTPWKDTWYSLYRTLGGPWDWSGWVCKVSQWGLNPRPSKLWCVAVRSMPSHPPIYQSYTTKISTLLKCFVIADIETIFHISKSVLVLSKALHHVLTYSPWPYTYCINSITLHISIF